MRRLIASLFTACALLSPSQASGQGTFVLSSNPEQVRLTWACISADPSLKTRAFGALERHKVSPHWVAKPNVEDAKRYAFSAFVAKVSSHKKLPKELHDSWLGFLKIYQKNRDPGLAAALVPGLVAMDFFTDTYSKEENAWVYKSIQQILLGQNEILKKERLLLPWAQHVNLYGAYAARYGTKREWEASYKRATWALENLVSETGAVKTALPPEQVTRSAHYLLQLAVLLDRNSFPEGKLLWQHPRLQALIRSLEPQGKGAIYAWEVAYYFDSLYLDKVRGQLNAQDDKSIPTIGLCFYNALKTPAPGASASPAAGGSTTTQTH